jgi:quercetin dioxygenase-like cupin family protein
MSEVFAAEDNEFAGERIVHLLQEPRHRTVHNEGDLYLLDVQVNPGDVSLPHTHDQPIMLTYISMADGPRDGQIGSNIDYATEAVTHKVSNAGPGLFRIIALVNGSAGNIDLEADRPSGLSGEPELENAWFRSYRVELAPGEETDVQLHQLPSVVVQVVDGLLQVTRDDQVIDELDHPGNWSWRKAGQSYSVKNVGGIATAVVINEGRF